MIVGTNPFAALMGGSPAPQAGAPAGAGLAGAADFAAAFGTMLGTPAFADAPVAAPSPTISAPQPQPGLPVPLADLALVAAGPVVQTSSLSETLGLLGSDPSMPAPAEPVIPAPLEADFRQVANAAASHLVETTPESSDGSAEVVSLAEPQPDRPSLPEQLPAPANAATAQVPVVAQAALSSPTVIVAAATGEDVEPDTAIGADDLVERDIVVDVVSAVEAHALPEKALTIAPPLALSGPATVAEDFVPTTTPEPSISRSGPVIEPGVAREPAAPQASQPGFAERLTASLTASPAPPASGSEPTTPTSPVPVSGTPAIASAEPAPPPAADVPTVTARPGRIGQEMGVEIARRLSAGGEELTVRLNPAEMGRIEVRLSFDERGSLRAVVAAESTAALEMLRRDSADLGRTLTDAGVRADAQSFRFDGRSGDGAAGQFWQRHQGGSDRRRAFGPAQSDAAADIAPIPRRLGTSGRVDLMA